MVPLLLAMPGNEEMALKLADALPGEVGTLLARRFPDRECYVQVRSDVEGRDVALVCTLDDPDPKFLQLLFAADLVRELGGKSIGLVAPYLAYMRQDARFATGEAITSRSFARQLSAAFDWLVTVDPHLHRYSSLNEVYSIPATVAHTAPLLGDWITAQVSSPLVIGPDSESQQWVGEVATRANAPHVVFATRRLGDRQVRVEAPELSTFRDRQPVLIDDIVSSGGTLVEAANLLVGSGFTKPVALIVHALFAEGAIEMLRPVTSRIISCDTVPHPTNGLSVADLLIAAIRQTIPCFPREREPSKSWS